MYNIRVFSVEHRKIILLTALIAAIGAPPLCKKKMEEERRFKTLLSSIEIRFIKLKDDSGLLNGLNGVEEIREAVLKEALGFEFIEVMQSSGRESLATDGETSFSSDIILSSAEGKIHYQINSALVREIRGDVPESYFATERGVADVDNLIKNLASRAAASFRSAAVQLKVSHSDDEEVVKNLKSSETPALLAAIDQCRERRLSICSKDLIALLKSDKEDILLRAIGAVSLLKIEESAETLASIVDSSKNPDILIAALNGLHEMGKAKSEAYLKDIAENHPAEAVRNYAKSLLSKDK